MREELVLVRARPELAGLAAAFGHRGKQSEQKSGDHRGDAESDLAHKGGETVSDPSDQVGASSDASGLDRPRSWVDTPW